jgi:riboflavin biosynthesis pyrimidine reductase
VSPPPRRPWIAANFVLSLDGKVSTRTFAPAGFGGPADKARLRVVRSLGDALLVGAATVAADSMSMGLTNPRLRRLRVQRGQAPEPLRAIVSNSGRIDPSWKVFGNTRSPLVLFAGRGMPADLCNSLPSCCDLWRFPGPVPLASVLAILRHDYGVSSLVCEGGPRLLRSLAALRALDKLFITFTPKIFGGASAPTLTGTTRTFLPAPFPMHLECITRSKGEVFAEFRATKKSPAPFAIGLTRATKSVNK